MIKNSLLIYCITNKAFPYLNRLPYKLAGVGQEHFPNNYCSADNLENIFYKEKYYSELTFQYWFWKNKLNEIKKDIWIGFCQKRRFWIKKNCIINKVNSLIRAIMNVYFELKWLGWISIYFYKLKITLWFIFLIELIYFIFFWMTYC